MRQSLDSSTSHTPEEDEQLTTSYKNGNNFERDNSNLESEDSAADFEKAITETGYGKFNYLLILLALPAACSSMYSTTATSYALPTASCDLELSDYDRGIINSAVYAGMMSSSFFWGYVSDKFGRKKTLVIGYFGDFLFSVGCSLSPDFLTLLIFRYLCGFMICGPFSTFIAYMSELFNASHRDTTLLLYGLFQSIGGGIQSCLAWATIPRTDTKWTLWDGWIELNSWRQFFLVCSLPSLVAAVGSSLCFESPKFFLAHGKKDEALRVFRSIYSFNTGKPADTYSVLRLKIDHREGDVYKKTTFWQDMTALFHPPHLNKALLGCFIQFGGLMSFNMMKLWLPQFFFSINVMSQEESLTTCEMLTGNKTSTTTDCDNFVVDKSIYVDMMRVNIATIILMGICTVAVNHFSKRDMLVTLFLLQTATISCLGWVRPPLTTTLGSLYVSVGNTYACNLLTFVVQIFPTRVRAMAVSIIMMVGRFGAFLGNAVLLPFLLSLSCHFTFVVTGAIALYCACFLVLLARLASKDEVKENDNKMAALLNRDNIIK